MSDRGEKMGFVDLTLLCLCSQLPISKSALADERIPCVWYEALPILSCFDVADCLTEIIWMMRVYAR